MAFSLTLKKTGYIISLSIIEGVFSLKENNSFSKGLKDGIPICLGYLSVSFAFGIYSFEAGLSVLETLLISMTNLTSAGQLAAVPIITASGSLAELAIAQLVINLRYALMSVSLSQKLGESIKFRHRFLISFSITDEIFAVAASGRNNVGKKYMLGLSLTPYFGWAIGTLLGAVAGNILPESAVSALGIAIYGMFVAIVVPVMRKQKSVALCVAIAVALSCIFEFVPFLSGIPGGFVIIICAVIASAIMAVVAPINTEHEEDDVYAS